MRVTGAANAAGSERRHQARPHSVTRPPSVSHARSVQVAQRVCAGHVELTIRAVHATACSGAAIQLDLVSALR